MSQEPLLYLAVAQLSKIVNSLQQTSKQGIKPSCSVALGKITNVTPELIKLKGLFFGRQTVHKFRYLTSQLTGKKKCELRQKIPLKNIFINCSGFLFSLRELPLMTLLCKDFCRQWETVCTFLNISFWVSNHITEYHPAFYLSTRKNNRFISFLAVLKFKYLQGCGRKRTFSRAHIVQEEFSASKQLGLTLLQDTISLKKHSGHNPGGTWMATLPQPEPAAYPKPRALTPQCSRKSPQRHWGTVLQKLNNVPWITFLLLRSVLFSIWFVHMLQILTSPSFNSYPHSKLIFI